MLSTSGLIRLPQKLLKEVLAKSRLLLLSYAYNITRLDRSVEKHHTAIIKILSFYKIKPLENYQLESKFKIKVDDSDLPTSYFKYKRNNVAEIMVFLDHTETRWLGTFKDPNVITVCTRALYNILSDPSLDEDRLFAIFADFDNTIEHELTHFVQKVYLHKENSERHYDLSVDKTMVPYYTSQIEFDPTIKTELSMFAAKLHDIFKDSPFDFQKMVMYYTDATTKSIEWPGFSKSSFFQILKKEKPDAYKKALKLFGAHAKEAYEQYKNFKDTAKDLKVERLDYVWSSFRANEFASFVQAINTFIAYPDSRLIDYESFKDVLPRIDDKFKQIRLEDKMFVRCTEAAIDLILNQKKAIKIETIFVESEIKGTGMMFDVSGLPMILDIHELTHDPEYIEVCEDRDIPYNQSKHGFAIVDGTNYKFNKRTLLGVYIKGKLQEKASE